MMFWVTATWCYNYVGGLLNFPDLGVLNFLLARSFSLHFCCGRIWNFDDPLIRFVVKTNTRVLAHVQKSVYYNKISCSWCRLWQLLAHFVVQFRSMVEMKHQDYSALQIGSLVTASVKAVMSSWPLAVRRRGGWLDRSVVVVGCNWLRNYSINWLLGSCKLLWGSL